MPVDRESSVEVDLLGSVRVISILSVSRSVLMCQAVSTYCALARQQKGLYGSMNSPTTRKAIRKRDTADSRRKCTVPAPNRCTHACAFDSTHGAPRDSHTHGTAREGAAVTPPAPHMHTVQVHTRTPSAIAYAAASRTHPRDPRVPHLLPPTPTKPPLNGICDTYLAGDERRDGRAPRPRRAKAAAPSRDAHTGTCVRHRVHRQLKRREVEGSKGEGWGRRRTLFEAMSVSTK